MWKTAEKFLSKDKYIGPLVKKYGPCKIQVRHKDNYFEDLVDAIVGQQLSIKAANSIYKRLLDKLGRITSDTILKTRDEEIRACGLSWAKVKYIKDLAQRTSDGRLKTSSLDKLSDEEVRRELVAVKGIGDWTADMFLMFTLGRKDIFPIGDLGLKNGMKKLLGKDMTADAMVKLSQRWSPYRTPASWYIWKSLDNS